MGKDGLNKLYEDGIKIHTNTIKHGLKPFKDMVWGLKQPSFWGICNALNGGGIVHLQLRGVSSATSPINMPALLTFQMGTLKKPSLWDFDPNLKRWSNMLSIGNPKVSMGASPMKTSDILLVHLKPLTHFPHGRCDQREGNAVTISILVES